MADTMALILGAQAEAAALRERVTLLEAALRALVGGNDDARPFGADDNGTCATCGSRYRAVYVAREILGAVSATPPRGLREGA